MRKDGIVKGFIAMTTMKNGEQKMGTFTGLLNYPDKKEIFLSNDFEFFTPESFREATEDEIFLARLEFIA